MKSINLKMFGGFYPVNPVLGKKYQSQADGVLVDSAFIAHYVVEAADAKAADADAVHAAITAGTEEVVVSTGFTSPDVPRNITATAGGTDGDIKAVSVVVEGTDFEGNTISEELPAFTADTAGTVTGAKAFKTVTKVTIPAMDGTGATVTIGFGSKFGIPYCLSTNTVLLAAYDDAKEATLPTVTVGSDISANGFTLNSSITGSKKIDLYFIV